MVYCTRHYNSWSAFNALNTREIDGDNITCLQDTHSGDSDDELAAYANDMRLKSA